MATAASRELYPLSTRDAKSIPLDVIRPGELLFASLTAEAHESAVIPDDFDIVAVYSTIDAIIDFTDTETYPIGAGSLNSAVLLPAQTIMTVSLPSVGPVRIIPLNAAESGWCVIQSVQKWAGLGLQGQLQTK